MPKESENVHKRCTFSFLVSSYDIQWMINVKPHSCVEQPIVSDLIVSGDSYHTRNALSYDMRPHKQTQSDTIGYSTHSCRFPIISGATDKKYNFLLKSIL